MCAAGFKPANTAQQESNSEQRNAAELSKGREQNKTKEWREMEQEQRKQMLKAVGKGVEAAGKAAETYSKKKNLDEKTKIANEEIEKGVEVQQEGAKQIEKGEEMQEQAVEYEKKVENSVTDVPKACPRCKEKWRGSGGMFGSQNYEELAPGRFQCTECGKAVNLG